MSERTRRWRYAAAALVSLLLALNWVPTGYFAVRPGPVRPLTGLVRVAGSPAPETSFCMVAVVAEKASVYGLVRALLDPSQEVWSKRDVYAGKTAAQYAQEQRTLMERSQRTAAYLAFKESGFSVGPDDPLPMEVSVESGEVLGPSAGLAFALEIASVLQGDLTRGRKIAATGVLDESGEVLPVGGIAQKAASCRAQGIEIFVVPAANELEARRWAGDMNVIGVRTFSEAVERLRLPGRQPGSP